MTEEHVLNLIVEWLKANCIYSYVQGDALVGDDAERINLRGLASFLSSQLPTGGKRLDGVAAVIHALQAHQNE
jgi:hypothetical protein